MSAARAAPRRRLLIYILLFLMSALNYGDRAALVLRPREGGGTVATISIPFRMGESA